MIQHNHNGAWVSGLLVLTTLLNLGRALYQKRHPVLPEGANRVGYAVIVVLFVLIFMSSSTTPIRCNYILDACIASGGQ